MTPYSTPRPSAEATRAHLAAEGGLPSRLGYTMLLLAGLASAAVTASLALTEPDLPTRTSTAFWVLTAIGLAWAAFAGWVLARRRTLFAEHRVMAGGMAVTFSAIFVLAALVFDLWAAAVAGGLMMIVAAALLVRARRRVAALRARMHELERQLHGPEAAS